MDNPYRLVQVVWQDSGNPHSGWKWVSSIENPPKHICQTVGWLVKDGKIVSLAQSIVLGEDGNHQINGLMQIPRRFINSIEDLWPKISAPSIQADRVYVSGFPEPRATIIGKLNDETKPFYDQPLEPVQEPAEKPADELKPGERLPEGYSIESDHSRSERPYVDSQFSPLHEFPGYWLDNFMKSFWERSSNDVMLPVVIRKIDQNFMKKPLPDLTPKENASGIFVVEDCKVENTKPIFSPRTYRKPYLIDYQYFQLTVYPEEDTDIGWDNKGNEFRLFYNGMNKLVDVQGTGRKAVFHETHPKWHDGPFTDGKGRQWQMVWVDGEKIPKKMPLGWHPPEEEK